MPPVKMMGDGRKAKDPKKTLGRLLSYMQSCMPVLACTDANTDIGQVITEGGFGWWCESNDVDAFCKCINQAATSDLGVLGSRGYEYLQMNYSVEEAARVIMDAMLMK